MLGPTLETERLILRPPEAADLDAWAEMLADPDSARFIGGVMSRALTWRVLALMTGSWPLRGFGMFSLVEKASGRCIGRAGPWQPEGWPGQEVGWGLIKSAWGQGYATEAASACLDWVFDTLEWTDVIHCIHPDNAPSAAVARRLGSTYLRCERLPPPLNDFDCEIWGQTQQAWRTRRRQG
jgi:RimJ/RimL family protein N-acetyltransferase